MLGGVAVSFVLYLVCYGGDSVVIADLYWRRCALRTSHRKIEYRPHRALDALLFDEAGGALDRRPQSFAESRVRPAPVCFEQCAHLYLPLAP